MASGLDDLAVIFKSVILISSEGDLIPVTNFVVFPMGIVWQKISVLISTQGSLGWLPSSAHRVSS